MSNIKLMTQLGIKVVGCTTTGLSKYRGFLSAMEPRTLLIEEAAETLESKIIAGMIESLQQLILVGDHKQLQASCTVQALQDEPYYISVSMFERLVKNSMPFVMLNNQRRMITDVRKLLCIPPNPFYRDLHDHESVLDRVNNRPPVPGMGGRDTYFFSHNWSESRTFDGSCFNLSEADMIAEFFNYLVLNGVDASKITVLTFYNGQRKTIIKQLKRHPSLGGTTYFNVFTVDSYQGEENDIILLSMVRSNQNQGVGFLDSKNRLVVALSRARRGLYLFGNSITLTAGETTELACGREPLYDPLIMFMRNQGRYDIDGGLPITCSQHKSTTRIYDADGWAMLAGGCQRRCEGGILPCGHSCFLKCHPFDHARVICREACTKTLPCGHGCSRNCGQSCVCDQCHVAETGLIFVPDNFEYWEPDPSVSPTSSLSPTKSALKNEDFQGSGYRQVRFNDDANPFTISDVRHDLHLSNSRVKTNGRPIPHSSKARGTGRRAASDLASRPSSTQGSSSSARSTPVKSRSGRSTPSHSRPAPSFAGSRLEHVVDVNRTGVKNWQNYNAKQADQDIDVMERMEAAKGPKVDPSSIVIKETYRPVIVKNGRRTKDSSGPVRTLIQSPLPETSIFQVPQEPESTVASDKTTPGNVPENTIQQHRLKIEKSLVQVPSPTASGPGKASASNQSDNLFQEQRLKMAKSLALQVSNTTSTSGKNADDRDSLVTPLEPPTEALAEQELDFSKARAMNDDLLQQKDGNSKEQQESQTSHITEQSLITVSETDSYETAAINDPIGTSHRASALGERERVSLAVASNEDQVSLNGIDSPRRDAGLTAVTPAIQLTPDPFDDFFGPLESKDLAEVLPLSTSERSSKCISVLASRGGPTDSGDAESHGTVVAHVEQASQLLDLLSIVDDYSQPQNKSPTEPEFLGMFNSESRYPGENIKGTGMTDDVEHQPLKSKLRANAEQINQPSDLRVNQPSQQRELFKHIEVDNGMGHDMMSSTSENSGQLAEGIAADTMDGGIYQPHNTVVDSGLLIDLGGEPQARTLAPHKSLIDGPDDVPSFSTLAQGDGVSDGNDEDLINF